MPHLVLLGDSIFDNRSYTGAEPDVVTHLRAMLPEAARATLLAVDGATTRSMALQLREIPFDATHLVVAIGGNDALGHVDLVQHGSRLTSDPLRHLAQIVDGFESNYRSALKPVFGIGLPTTICTIYNGALEDPAVATRARVALMMFNDVIIRVAVEYGASIIDLRSVCREQTDYANPIEPSGAGGLKIATSILRTTGIRPIDAHSVFLR